MAKLSDEQLRARSPKGRSEALLMAHGFPMEMPERLVTAGFAEASLEEMRIARRRRKVVCFQITVAGRKAAAGKLRFPRHGKWNEDAATFTVTSRAFMLRRCPHAISRPFLVDELRMSNHEDVTQSRNPLLSVFTDFTSLVEKLQLRARQMKSDVRGPHEEVRVADKASVGTSLPQGKQSGIARRACGVR
jgi:hypothetical protein